jgi:RsiW-degrading membrane proteinase PrsW (M82 family)
MTDLPPPQYGERVTPGTPSAEFEAPAELVKPPRRWLGRRGGFIILAGFAVVWLYLILFSTLVEHSRALPTTALILGGFGLAAALIYTMAYRLVPADGITVSRLLIAFLVGGVISTVLAGSINYFVNHASGGVGSEPTLTALSLAGVVEELCKIVAVVIVSRKLANRSARNGLFIGGAVGLGFSAIEDMGYQLKGWDLGLPAHPFGSLAQVVVTRDLLGPFEHPIYTALFAAALFAASRNGRFRITIGVIGAYLGVALMHGLVDSSAEWINILLPQPVAVGLLGLGLDVFYALISWLVWLFVSRHLRNRMRANQPDPPPTIDAQ